MPPLLRELLRPRRRTIVVILATTLVQMAMSLAAPWPLKVVLDNVVGSHPPPHWIGWLLPMLGGNSFCFETSLAPDHEEPHGL